MVRIHRFGAVAVVLTALIAIPVRAQARVDTSFAVKGGKLSAAMFTPAKTPAPAVIVLHPKTGAGHEQADEAYAQALAGEGFVGIVVDYLALADGKLWSPKIDAELSHVVDLLHDRPETRGEPVGIVGFSLGAHGILVSARNPAVKAVVVYYGAYDVRKAKGLHLPPAVKLPVDVAAKVSAPVLLLHGAEDNEIPVDNAREMEAALKAAGKRVTLMVYPGAYHRFDRGPTATMDGDTNRQGYIYRYDQAATKDAWRRSVAFLRANLGN